ncbi:amino acid ABC transporter permease [uncultured Jatrophihabitans sp.]|uniref:amino acid ABC transporter permease n=1 Tax=uncultured Jatrophihabitans sp. TaxID=1610747 RepID=UPI0035CC19BF
MTTLGTPPDSAQERPSDIKAVPVRHPGRWVAVVVIAVLVAMLVHTVVFAKVKRGNANESRFGWGVVGDYLFSQPVLHGLELTLLLTVVSMAIGIIGGILLAVMRLSDNPVLSSVSWLFIWFFRGTPLLVQIAFWYVGISYLFPPPNSLSLGVPFGPAFLHGSANDLVTPLVAGFVGLGLNEAAYMAEIVRAGILSVDEGQTEAAQSLGMSRGRTMRRIVLPQAMRVIIPPTGNETISMLKNSALASVATVAELYFAQGAIAARTYQTVPLLLVASIWYLVATSVLTVGQYYLERYFARGSSRSLPPTPIQRARALFSPSRAPVVAAPLDAGPLSAGRH